ncbi:hypothetical protein AVEN_146075-1 [Araneus ventricosus]|uniref:Uncharacterized protein n=1 Tax=Araneus ventricosus TaxID=182803 RepID=A0A4Y2F3Z7_ARAVE|nr:hypothetical protein AVEN_146075-1 [Araneus ventricosus]
MLDEMALRPQISSSCWSSTRSAWFRMKQTTAEFSQSDDRFFRTWASGPREREDLTLKDLHSILGLSGINHCLDICDLSLKFQIYSTVSFGLKVFWSSVPLGYPNRLHSSLQYDWGQNLGFQM